MRSIPSNGAPNEKQKKKKTTEKIFEDRTQQDLQEMAERGRCLDHHRRKKEPRLSSSRTTKSAITLSKHSGNGRDSLARHRRERVQGRTLSAHCVCQRALPQRGIPGWKERPRPVFTSCTVRADEVESHPSGGTYERPIEEGGGENRQTFPFEDWRYRYLEGIGQEVIIEFVDNLHVRRLPHDDGPVGKRTRCSTLQNAGLTLYEQMGHVFQGESLQRRRVWKGWGRGPNSANLQTKQFDRLEQFAKLQAPPPVKFKDLEEIVNTKLITNLMPFDVALGFCESLLAIRLLVPITIQMKYRDITFAEQGWRAARYGEYLWPGDGR